jgi:CRISPR-associated protein Cst2
MYVKVATKLLVNLHDLNNERPTDIRRVYIVDETGRDQEVTAISGLMLKHYHFIFAKQLLELWGYKKFCEYCARGESYRVPEDDVLLNEIISKYVEYVEKGEKRERRLKKPPIQIGGELEEEAIKRCAFEDMHGLLFPHNLVPIRRESPIRFSWLLPIIGTETPAITATHTRVSRVAAPEEQQMMIFYKQYSSGVYGMTASIDLVSIGRSYITGERVLPDDEYKLRIKGALLAFVPMLGGELGASLTRALPHVKPLELLVTCSEVFPIPALVSPIYANYASLSLDMYRKLANFAKAKIRAFGVNVAYEEVTDEFFSFKKKATFAEPFLEILS